MPCARCSSFRSRSFYSTLHTKKSVYVSSSCRPSPHRLRSETCRTRRTHHSSEKTALIESDAGLRINNNIFSLKGPGNHINTQELLCSCTKPQHTLPRLFLKHTMSHRATEEKDQRRVSSTVLGKRKSTGDGATSRPTPRTSGRANQGVNTVPRSKDYIYSTVKYSIVKTNKSRSNRTKTSITKTAEEQTSISTEDVGSPPTMRTSLGPAHQEVSKVSY